MAINKVTYKGQTLVDLTQDTVTPESLMEGVTAHAKNGEMMIGTASGGGQLSAFLAGELTEITEKDIGNVKKIQSNAFSSYTDIKQVSIPDTVEIIGQGAFYDVYGLTEIEIPASVTNIEDSAFGDCKNLCKVIVNNEYLSHPSYDGFYDSYGGLFNNAKQVVDNYTGNTYAIEGTSIIDTPDGFRFILEEDGEGNDYYMLVGYLGNEDTVTLPTDINGSSYEISGLFGVKNVIIPSGVTRINDGAFKFSKILTNVEIQSDLEFISSNAFSGSSIKNIELPDSLGSIGSYAFYGCSSLESIKIPKNITGLSYGTFGKCFNLTSVTLGAGFSEFDDGAFSDCHNISEIIVDENNNNFVTVDGILYNKDLTNMLYIPAGITSVTLPNSSILLSGASGRENIVTVQFADDANITSIPQEAFEYCYNLQNIDIPSSVTSIGGGAFRYCSSLTSIVIPEGVTEIIWDTFSGCSSLTSVEIPSSVTSIGSGAFYYCNNLVNISFNGTVAQWRAITKENNWVYETPSDCMVYCTDGTVPPIENLPS